MIPVIATALAGIVTDVIKSFLPDTSEDKLRKIELAIQQQTVDNEIIKAQLAINAEEAKSDNLFVSGGRPAVIWICAFGLAWQCLVQPILLFITTLVGHPIVAPVFDTVSMITMLSGLLGLGAMRSFDKYQGK